MFNIREKWEWLCKKLITMVAKFEKERKKKVMATPANDNRTVCIQDIGKDNIEMSLRIKRSHVMI